MHSFLPTQPSDGLQSSSVLAMQALPSQQSALLLHRTRDLLVTQRTQLVVMVRGHAELVVSHGVFPDEPESRTVTYEVGEGKVFYKRPCEPGDVFMLSTDAFPRIEFLSPENPHVLAYLREYEGDVILVVNNLAGTAQAVQLELSRFDGCTPVEMLGHTEFLPIDESPYALTLSPYGFFWVALRHVPAPGEVPEGMPADGWSEEDARLLEQPAALAGIVSSISTEWLREQRWFRGKAREILGVELSDHVLLRPDQGPATLLAIGRVRYAEGDPELYLLALTVRPPARDAEPLNDHEPVDSSASAIAAQGLLRLGRYLGSAGSKYTQAGLTVSRTLLDEPYLSTDPAHQGLLRRMDSIKTSMSSKGWVMARKVLEYIHAVWRRPVCLETIDHAGIPEVLETL